MATAELRQRTVAKGEPAPDAAAGEPGRLHLKEIHPAGKKKHGPIYSLVRAVALVTYFAGSCIAYGRPGQTRSRAQ